MSLSTEEFASRFLGIDPVELIEEAEPDVEVTPEDQEETPETVADEAEADADESPEAEEEAEPEKEPVILPFEAKANDEAVDPSLLAEMVLTFKADGKTESMPLADIVRRAQSEPAAQRQARSATAKVEELERRAQALEADLNTTRDVALRMARDPDYYTEMSGQIAAYDTPEARAERAEKQLAAERDSQKRTREQAEFERSITSFTTDVVAPALDSVITANPLVTEEELLGRFYADTAKWTVNGRIDPRFHQDLALYLRSEFADFASQRQSKRAEDMESAKKEARKSQVERQRMKNQTAQAAKPLGTAGAVRDESAKTAKPRTLKEAERGALDTLLGNLG